MFGPSKRELLQRIDRLEEMLAGLAHPSHDWGWRVTMQDLVTDFQRRNEPVDGTPRKWVPSASE